MTEWGPAIAVDGKRPEWLGDGQEFQAGGGCFEWFGISVNGTPHIWNQDPNREPSWDGVDHIRLPANHPHYRTEATMTVNWQEPIEAVHQDGRVAPVCLKVGMSNPNPDDAGDYYTTGQFDDYDGIWRPDGSSWGNLTPQWTIRNTLQATEKPRTAPNGGEVGPEVVERMIVHLRGMAVQYDAGKREIDYAYAKDIVALLPEPVDPDLVEARKLANDYSCMEIDYVGGDGDQTSLVKIAVVAIKRGRQLERGGE